MTVLGAIFAGGAARRFGADKATATLHGRPMIEHVADRLRGQCDALAVIGRDWSGLDRVDDRPSPGRGPLGALAGALAHAEAAGHEWVLSSGCDLPDLPLDLAARLMPGPAVIAGQLLLGLWPAALSTRLIDYLESGGHPAVHSWIALTGACQIQAGRPIANLNTPSEFEAFVRSRDSR